MNRKIIFTTISMAFILSGCLATKPTIEKIDKVDKKIKKVDNSAKKVDKVIKEVKDEVKSSREEGKIDIKKDEVTKPEESNLHDDVVIETEVDITDDNSNDNIDASIDYKRDNNIVDNMSSTIDDTKPQIIESVD